MNKTVNFELAKMLKENGYNNICNKLWHYNGSSCIKCLNKNDENLGFSAPNIFDVVDWLYKEFKIWICVYTMDKYLPNGNDNVQYFDYGIKVMVGGLIDISKKIEEFNTPYECYLAAFKFILTHKPSILQP